jgi:hypothetical protein
MLSHDHPFDESLFSGGEAASASDMFFGGEEAL